MTLQAAQNALRSTHAKVLVPWILIEGQTVFDGSELGDMKFTITDEFNYCSQNKPLRNTECGVYFIKPNQVKTTIFRKCCPEISLFSVLRGEGSTSFEKAKYLYNRDAALQAATSFYEFYYYRLTLYSMAKYIISKILYGKFCIRFLLGKFDEEFYKNLSNTRFCGAVRIFNGPDELAAYNKYFKFDIECKKHFKINTECKK